MTQKDSPKNDSGLSWLRQYYTPEKTADSGTFDASGLLAQNPTEKYRLLGEVATGGMKSVRRVLDCNAARHVAMARLKGDAPHSEAARRFLREARITAFLEHPNIVPIHEIGVDEAGNPYFTMKMLGGETLHQILKKRRAGDSDYIAAFPPARLLQIFLGVCNAVAFAHSKGVIHLDLKSANIQVGGFGEVLVLDWGLAKIMGKGTALLDLPPELSGTPAQGMVLGTPECMAPEQEAGNHDSLDERTDIHALGALLESMLCEGSEERIPTGLKAVIAKARAAAPAARYSSVEDLAREVRAFVEGFPTQAQEASLLTQFRMLIERHRTTAALGSASLVLILAIVAVSFFRIRHSEQVAVKALADIQREQKARHELGLVAAPRVLQQAGDSIHRLDYDQALPILDYVVTLDGTLAQAWDQKAALHLGRLEFPEAAEAALRAVTLDAGENKPVIRATLAEVAERHGPLLRGEGGPERPALLHAFLLDIANAERTPWTHRLLAIAVLFQNLNQNPETTDFALIETALHRLNPGAQNLVFSHEAVPGGLKIGVHGTGITQVLPLIGLPIVSLDLSGTSVGDLNWVRNAPLAELDLSGTDVLEFSPLSRTASLEKLRLTGWQRKDYTRLRALPQLKTLILNRSDLERAAEALRPLKQQPKLIGE
jgi:hypothetical protein